MKTKKKVLVMLIAMMMVLASAIPTFAAGSNYTAKVGEDVTIKKYLVLPSDANVPSATFTFAIEPSAKAGDGSNMDVLAGPTGATVTATVTFSSSDSTTAGAANDGIANGTDKKYAAKDVTVTLTGVSFTEPGVYRYKITESGTNTGITNDPDNPKYLDIYITDDNGTLKQTKAVLHNGDSAIGRNANGDQGSGTDTDKAVGFLNTMKSQQLEFEKKVTGNQGSKDKYFKFTVTATNVADTDKFAVDMSGANTNPTKTDATAYEATDMVTANNVTEVTGAALKAGKVFYLRHGDKVVIKGLPEGATYAVTEDKEDYKQTAGTTTATDPTSGTIGKKVVQDDNGTLDYTGAALADPDSTEAANRYKLADDQSVSTGWTNTRDGIIPTGVALAILPGLLILAFGIIGVTLYMKKKAAARR